MNTSLTHIIKAWVPEKSKVIDFGCGDGSLLKDLIDQKNIRGYGVEIDHNKIQECIDKGISVVEKDIDEGIQDFETCNFDVAIMASSIQCLKEPHLALRKMLKLSKQCIVTLPNLGFWKCRLDLVQGRMPVTPNLPSSWYETKNLHLCTIKDFETLCVEEGFVINERLFLNDKGVKSIAASTFPNTFASEGVYLLAKNNKILLASSNQGKIREFKKIFNGFELISQAELGIDDAIEDGISFFENALKKARHGSKQSNLFTVADDSGLVVPELDYAPGIYSARYAGEGASDKDNRDKIIAELNKKNVPSLDAFYVCVLVGVRSDLDPIPLYSIGEIHGKISTIGSGDGGFGYDKIFYPNGYSVSMASIDAEEKNRISHRGIAAKSFIKELEKL